MSQPSLPLVDPDGPASDEGGLFGVQVSVQDAALVVIPVPWEATASYGRGTARGPEAVRAASLQVDLEDLQFGAVWTRGLGWAGDVAVAVAEDAEATEDAALYVIDAGGADQPSADAELVAARDLVDLGSARVRAAVRSAAEAALDRGALAAVLGGDHSSPLGLIEAVAARHPGVGILHVDAHADLRVAYLGFRESHASIMHNALELPGVACLVGVAYRDLGSAEVARIADDPAITAFYDRDLGAARCAGQSFDSLVEAIVEKLPQKVYLSIDIDGLDPVLCPETGTPVPGGLGWHELCALLVRVSACRTVVGFDLCEVAPGAAAGARRDGWDAIVGARVLYKLAGAALCSQAGSVDPDSASL